MTNYPTLKDVSAEAGVSMALASVVLNGKKSRIKASPETRKKIIDAVLVNDSLPDNISDGYAKTGSIPVRLDMENIAPIGVEIVSQKLIQENKQGLVRHSSNRVARAVYYWYKKAIKK